MKIAILLAALVLGTAAVAEDDDFDRAASALAAGSRAVASGDRARLRAAALALRASGAAPVAGDDLAMTWLRLAHVAAPPADRDRALGPGYRALALGGGDAAIFEQTFLAGQRARVVVIAVGGSDFAMQVSNAGAPLCRAEPDHARCDWVPSYTSRFTIRIANPGPREGRYFVMMQ